MSEAHPHIVQVAGVRDEEEARMLVDAGVDFLGFPLRLAVHEPDTSEAEAAAIIATLTEPNLAVVITYLDNAADVVSLCAALAAPVVQLHGPITLREVEQIRADAPHLRIIKSLIVRGEDLDALLGEVAEYSAEVDAFITDSFDPATGASGATGRTHDWETSAAIVAKSRVPVILAGGLNPDNVYDAIARVRPNGVDVHSGVEDAHGRKDPALVRRFIGEARRGFTDHLD